MGRDLDIQETARVLLRKAGLPMSASIERLTGGRNNRVFRLTLVDGRLVALKHYHSDARDLRDRLATEFRFLTYAWQIGVRAVPQPLACEPGMHAALYSFLPGRKLARGEISRDHVVAALKFVHAINPSPRNPLTLPPGSQACFSMAEHLAAIDQCLHRLTVLDPDVKERLRAEAFINTQLHPAWREIKAQIAREMNARGIASDRLIGESETCISPSDFGFHNALIDDAGNLVFLDFEYAGQDDPAKLVCDFFSQPDVPVPMSYYEGFVDKMAQWLGLEETFRARCDLLLKAYRIKWICILLNDLLPTDAARRSFADPMSYENRCRWQLTLALRKMEELQLH